MNKFKHAGLLLLTLVILILSPAYAKAEANIITPVNTDITAVTSVSNGKGTRWYSTVDENWNGVKPCPAGWVAGIGKSYTSSTTYDTYKYWVCCDSEGYGISEDYYTGTHAFNREMQYEDGTIDKWYVSGGILKVHKRWFAKEYNNYTSDWVWYCGDTLPDFEGIRNYDTTFKYGNSNKVLSSGITVIEARDKVYNKVKELENQGYYFKDIYAMTNDYAASLGTDLRELSFAPRMENWKYDSTGWWFVEGNSWATGWRFINGEWYFFEPDGYMAHHVGVDYEYENSDAFAPITVNGNWDRTIKYWSGQIRAVGE